MLAVSITQGDQTDTSAILLSERATFPFPAVRTMLDPQSGTKWDGSRHQRFSMPLLSEPLCDQIQQYTGNSEQVSFHEKKKKKRTRRGKNWWSDVSLKKPSPTCSGLIFTAAAPLKSPRCGIADAENTQMLNPNAVTYVPDWVTTSAVQLYK